MPSAETEAKFVAGSLDAQQLRFEECISAAAPGERNKLHCMEKPNRHQTESGFRNEIARGSDVQNYRVGLSSDRYFNRTTGHAAPDWFAVVLFRRSIATGMARAIFHACHQIRLALFG
jgi:hypothetical protein